jgi:hypothetical protein
VVERRALLTSRRIDQHELVATLHGLAIPEPSWPNPGRRLRDVDRQPGETLVYRCGAAIVVERTPAHGWRESNDRTDPDDAATCAVRSPMVRTTVLLTRLELMSLLGRMSAARLRQPAARDA